MSNFLISVPSKGIYFKQMSLANALWLSVLHQGEEALSTVEIVFSVSEVPVPAQTGSSFHYHEPTNVVSDIHLSYD